MMRLNDTGVELIQSIQVQLIPSRHRCPCEVVGGAGALAGGRGQGRLHEVQPDPAHARARLGQRVGARVRRAVGARVAWTRDTWRHQCNGWETDLG